MSERESSPIEELRDLVAPGVDRIAEVIPEAVALRTAQDDKLGRALAPTVEKAIQESVESSPETIADAIFPVIGPAIRKSISESIRGLMQNLNQTLEHSLSAKGMRWRIEAMRTGRPIAEVVMRNTLLYRVEHVFLIHRESGLLVASVSEDPRVQENADVISGMLTAIRDFAEDSFGGAESTPLDSIQLGELVVHMQQGPHAIVAAVIRGTPPREALAVLPEVAEEVHETFGRQLREFDGDTEGFTNAERLLQRCVTSQLKPERKRISPILVLVGVVLAVAVGFWIFGGVRESYRAGRLEQVLGAEPGVVLVEVVRSPTGTSVRGLRDPLSRPIETVASEAGLDLGATRFDWEPYQSLDPAIVALRVGKALAPPPEVELEILEGRLTARGRARRDWIQSAQERALLIGGIDAVDFSGVQPDEREGLRRAVDTLEGLRVGFPPASTVAEASALDAVRQASADLDERLGRAGCRATVVIRGHTDPSGSLETNLTLSSGRATAVRDALATPTPRHLSFEIKPGGPLAGDYLGEDEGRVAYLEVSVSPECGVL